MPQVQKDRKLKILRRREGIIDETIKSSVNSKYYDSSFNRNRVRQIDEISQKIIQNYIKELQRKRQSAGR